MSAPSPLVFRSACAAGFLATALAGWHLAAPETRASAGKVVEAGNAVDSKHRERKLRDGGMPEQVRETMAAIRAAATPEQRMRATIDLVQSMPLSDLEQWLENRWFDSGDSYDFTLFNKIAYQRWEAEDPEGLIAYHLKSNSYRAQEMLAKLAKDDPAKALAFCAGRPNPSIELEVLSSVLKADPKLALQHVRAMLERGAFNDSNYYQGDQFFQELVKKDPAALESLLAAMPARLRQRAEGALTGQKLKADFAGTLKELMERPDGYKAFRNAYAENDNSIRAGILDHLAELPDSWKRQIANEPYNLINPDNAGKWLEADLEGMGFTGEGAKNVWNFAIQYYANKNPTEALAMLGSMDLEKHNRENVIENIFRNAQRDPKKMEELMASLETDEDRAIAQKFVKVPDENGETVARKEPHLIKEPKEWLEAVMSGDRANANNYTYYIQQWPKEKIEELTTEFRGMAAADKSSLAMLLASANHGDGGGSAQGLQGEAILYLVKNPPPKEEGKEGESPSPFGPSRGFDANGAASRHAVFLAQKDPDAASQWVQSLPAGETRQWAQKNLAKNWAMYDPEAMQQWVNTLPSTERKGVQEFLEKKER